MNVAGARADSSLGLSDRQMLLAAVITLLVLRLALVFSIPVEQFSDLAWYLNRALGIVAEGRYAEGGQPTAYWPVGYPAFLAGIMHLTKPAAWVGQVANVILSLCCQLLLFVWCRRQFGNARVAVIAAIMLALYPNHMGYSAGLYSEPLFTALLLGVCVLVTPTIRPGLLVVAGILAGLATLVKTQGLLIGPALVFLLSLTTFDWRSSLRAAQRTVLAGLFMALTIAPWTYRNWVVFEAPILVSTNGGMSLLAGNNPSMNMSLTVDYSDSDPLFQTARFSVADQVAANQRAKAAAWGWILENPERFLMLMPKKLFRLWVPDGEAEWLYQAGFARYEDYRLAFRSVRVANQLYYLLLLGAAAYAWWRWRRFDRPAAWVLPLLIGYFSAVSMVFSGQSRYHAPLMPFIIAYAAYAVYELIKARRARVQR